MPKMDWDKINRRKYGKKPDLPVVSEDVRFGLRPRCKFYAISNNKRFGCDEFIALGIEDDRAFCPKHQKSTFNGEELGWRMDPQIRKKFQLQNRRKWKEQVKEEKLAKEMNQRYGRT